MPFHQSQFDTVFQPAAMPVQHLHDEVLEQTGVCLSVKRLDLVHPQLSGNKFFKLKYNMQHALRAGFTKVLTFGGAHSNHIAATAFAARACGLKCILVVRGDELGKRFVNDRAKLFEENTTLKFAHEQGAVLLFVSRAVYRKKQDANFLAQLSAGIGFEPGCESGFKLGWLDDAYVIAEGGTNALAVSGCAHMLSDDELRRYNVIATAVGTGGTLAGMNLAINRASQHLSKAAQDKTGSTKAQHTNTSTQALGIAVVRDDSLDDTVAKLSQGGRHWHISKNYHFGGYAKVDAALITFINWFYATHNIGIEPVYTGKLFFAIYDLVKKGYFPRSSHILALHTGGMQGLAAMQNKLANAGLK